MNYNKYVDHTLLKPDCTDEQIEKLCKEAKEYDFASVCVNSSYVKKCADILKGTDVKICTVVGFPLGACSTYAKVCETKKAIEDGANCLGYHYWGVIDNWSWCNAFKNRYGFIRVCLDDGYKRKEKKSAAWIREVARTNEFE